MNPLLLMALMQAAQSGNSSPYGGGGASPDRSGGLFGGQPINQGDRYGQMTGRGGAPLTGAGLLAAGQNAMSLMGPMNPMGMMGLGMTATGSRPGGLLGNLFGGGIQNIPGHYGIPGKPTTLKEYLDARDRGAAASHGGGHTGERSGFGGAGGGPRGGQQMGGGKRAY